ncbi:hypothetical protein DPMN_044863 [Dreissena polymorpha]|uniref:Uncharacterized protein n=1 Tax=Dreissena polymorpha TaxID=45954 RepID=A0A9D4HZ70_DREPO|nr:hypothetical protein DPMN_044863 [Dreissena polymorpha]
MVISRDLSLNFIRQLMALRVNNLFSLAMAGITKAIIMCTSAILFYSLDTFCKIAISSSFLSFMVMSALVCTCCSPL